MPSRTILSALNQAVKDGVFPGAVLLVSHRDKICFHEAAGFAAVNPRKIRMTRATLFDLASLTKPVATTTAVMILVDRSEIKLGDPVNRWIPEFSGRGKDGVTIRHLLNHSSGLRAWEPLYKEVIAARRRRPGFIGSPDAKRLVLDRVHRNRLVYSPGAKSLYSDLGFILLGELIENVIGQPLDRFCRKEIFRPLEMRRTFYIKTGPKHRGRFASTERSEWRKKIVTAQVHDDNAYVMGGVSGHAGLFGTAMDLNRFAKMMLGSLRGQDTLVSPKIIEAFVSPQTTPGSSWALGWDTPSDPSSSGRFFSPRSFGHLGYTGTSLWIDPEQDLVVVLLTNRVHPTSRNIKIRKFRPMIHDLVYQEFIHDQT
jgi:CubicO group peptidase (beta-lactamase class C family)